MTTPEPTAIVALPGAFCEWFDGTGLVYGQDDEDPECKTTRLAYEQAHRIKAGRGYSRHITATPTVLHMLIEYGGGCLDANHDEPQASEVRAARQVIERALKALESFK